jgi:hypothetical protein
MAISKSACVIVAGLASLALSACQNKEPLGPGFGDSVRHNIAVQSVNPIPPTVVQGPSEMAGPRAGLAIERYDTGKIIELRNEQTTKPASGSGGGGGGGGQR